MKMLGRLRNYRITAKESADFKGISAFFFNVHGFGDGAVFRVKDNC